MKKSPINKGYAAKPSPFMQSKDDIIKAVTSGDTSAKDSDAPRTTHHDAPIIGGGQDKLNDGGGNITSGSTTEKTDKETIAKGSIQGYTIYKELKGDGIINRKNTKVVKGKGLKKIASTVSKKIGSRAIPGLGWGMTILDVLDFGKDLYETSGDFKESGRRWLYGENTSGKIF